MLEGFEVVPSPASRSNHNSKPSSRHRRDLLLQSIQVVPLLGITLPAKAAAPKVKPALAFETLSIAEQELRQAAKKYLPTSDYDGLRDFLATSELKNFETYSTAILSSKLLSEEDKKSIGTIRTYGVGADVQIMFGGLMAELDDTMVDEPNRGDVVKYMTRTIDALSEVLTICRNSGSF
ncbi:expressed unknown protein [Seminavis robusta]|uniref:Uncharacterized protein n=1 Tax=Seminavis robusta TaxID=568900 RepID=A0A9N8DDJ2_9STRA|nr:expressed unknown protein [Seminavis robusta]|eukprot:Sro98_g050270.1 n/a (179) ;mRNA; f:11900-12436